MTGQAKVFPLFACVYMTGSIKENMRITAGKS